MPAISRISCTGAPKLARLIYVKDAGPCLRESRSAQMEGIVSSAELAVLILILAAFAAFISTLGWASRH